MTKYLNLRLLSFIGRVKLGQLAELDQKRSDGGIRPSPSGRSRSFAGLPVKRLPNVADFSLEVGPWHWLFSLFYMYVSTSPLVKWKP